MSRKKYSHGEDEFFSQKEESDYEEKPTVTRERHKGRKHRVKRKQAGSKERNGQKTHHLVDVCKDKDSNEVTIRIPSGFSEDSCGSSRGRKHRSRSLSIKFEPRVKDSAGQLQKQKKRIASTKSPVNANWGPVYCPVFSPPSESNSNHSSANFWTCKSSRKKSRDSIRERRRIYCPKLSNETLVRSGGHDVKAFVENLKGDERGIDGIGRGKCAAEVGVQETGKYDFSQNYAGLFHTENVRPTSGGVFKNTVDDNASSGQVLKATKLQSFHDSDMQTFGNFDDFQSQFSFRQAEEVAQGSELNNFASPRFEKQNEETSCKAGLDEILFPFHKTESGKLKISKDQVAFESEQVAILVGDPQRTRVSFRQDREMPRCRMTPPPVPPSPRCNFELEGNSNKKCLTLDQATGMETSGCTSARDTSCLSSACCSPRKALLSYPVCEAQEENQVKCQALSRREEEVADFSLDSRDQCVNQAEFVESFHYRLRRAIHYDTKVICESKEFPCHGIALQAYSKYFDRLKRPKDTVQRIELPKEIISAEEFPTLMDWILLDDHSKCSVITACNVLCLYSAACYLGMPGLLCQCTAFIEERIKEGDPNLLSLYEDACRKPKCKTLLGTLANKLVQLFPMVYKSRKFLTLGSDELICLIDSDHVCIESELQIYDTAIRWILHDWKTRSRCIIQVMGCVRFGLLTPLELTQIQHCSELGNFENYHKILAVPEVERMIQDGLAYAIFREYYKSKPREFTKWLDCSKVCRPRARKNLQTDGASCADLQDFQAGTLGLDRDSSGTRRSSGSMRKEIEEVYDYQIPDNDKVKDESKEEALDADKTLSGEFEINFDSEDVSPLLSEHKDLGEGGYADDEDDGRDERKSSETNSSFASEASGGKDSGGELRRPSILKGSAESLKGKYSAKQIQAIVKIQSFIRGYLIRKRYKKLKEGATTLQRAYRDYRERKVSPRSGRRGSLLLPGRESVLVFGGMNPKEAFDPVRNNCQNIYRYNPEENFWRVKGQLPEPRSHCGGIVLQGLIYVFGGHDPRVKNPDSIHSNCWSLNPRTGAWTALARMKAARTNFAFCSFRGKIYAFGGKDSSGAALTSCERFDPRDGNLGKWEYVLSLRKPCMSGAAVKHGDKIFLVGGVSLTAGGKHPILKRTWIYDPLENTWEAGAGMEYGRCYAQLASRYNRLYVVGGAGKPESKEGTISLDEVTALEDDKWSRVGALAVARHGHAMVKVGKHFIVIGGVSSKTMEALASVEIYSTETNKSSNRIADLPQPLIGMVAINV